MMIEKMDLLIGKFLHEKDDQKRSEMRYLEGKRVMIQQLLLHGYRRQINQFDPAFKGKHMEEIVEMISGKSDFEEYIAHLQRAPKVNTENSGTYRFSVKIR